MGAGHDYRRRTYDCLLYHATRRTGAGSALGHFRRGPLSLERDDDRPVACGIRILHALAQAFVTGPATKRFGEKQAIIAGMAADALGYVLLAFATRGWMAFPIMILLASGGIGMPALQAMLSRQVDDDHQGQLQGSLAALTSLTSIIGPLIVTAIYAASASTWNGLAWIVGAALYLVCLPALRRGAWSRATST